MNGADKTPLKVRLTEEADEYIDALQEDQRNRVQLREGTYNRDKRPVGIIAPFAEKLEQLHGLGRMGVNEYAIAASFFRDVRVFAAANGHYSLFRSAFRNEHVYLKRKLVKSKKLANRLKGFSYTLWGLSCRYGTSLWIWLFWGIVAIGLFAVILNYVNGEAVGLGVSLLESVETFSQSSYDVANESIQTRITLLCERIAGLVYIAFGFSLLLPQLSIELARTKLSSE